METVVLVVFLQKMSMSAFLASDQHYICLSTPLIVVKDSTCVSSQTSSANSLCLLEKYC